MKKVLSLMLIIVIVIFIVTLMSTTAFATSETLISNKEELYAQYQATVEEAIAKHDAKIELAPFEEFDFSIANPG